MRSIPICWYDPHDRPGTKHDESGEGRRRMLHYTPHCWSSRRFVIHYFITSSPSSTAARNERGRFICYGIPSTRRRSGPRARVRGLFASPGVAKRVV